MVRLVAHSKMMAERWTMRLSFCSRLSVVVLFRMSIKFMARWQKEGTVGSMTGVERGMKLLRGDNILKVIDPPVPGTLA
jgi:hypothetical protein